MIRALALCLLAAPAGAAELTVRVTGGAAGEGVAAIDVFASEADWMKRPAAGGRARFGAGGVAEIRLTNPPANCYSHEMMKQLDAAILAAPGRDRALKKVAVPAAVIHGVDDPLVRVEGGRATAAAIPGAELVEIPGMGHDLPRQLWPRIVEIIAQTAGRAGAAAAA